MIATFRNKEEPDYDQIVLSFVEGAVYHFRGIEGPRKDGRRMWVVPPGDYRLVGVGKQVNTNQELVAYRCVANNKLFFCTLNDWTEKFEAPQLIRETPAVAEPLPEKKAGSKDTGIGW